MKSVILTLSFVSLLTLTSCAGINQGRDLTAVESNKVIVVNAAMGQFFFTANGKEKTDAGYKFNFSIGNKNFAQFEGLNIVVRWGKNPAKKDKKATKISVDNLKAETFKIATLKAGEWQNFDVVIPAKNESEMEIINLVVSGVEKISLLKSN
jgi:hypothetical protein